MPTVTNGGMERAGRCKSCYLLSFPPRGVSPALPGPVLLVLSSSVIASWLGLLVSFLEREEGRDGSHRYSHAFYFQGGGPGGGK